MNIESKYTFDHSNITTNYNYAQNTRTMIGELEFPTCIMNASGVHSTNMKEIQDVYDNFYTGAVVTKSCTLKQREGNEIPKYYSNYTSKNCYNHRGLFSINSDGLQNYGHIYYGYCSGTIKKTRKPYFVSVAGMSVDDNVDIIESLCSDFPNIDVIELNLFCPNIENKPQVGYDFEDMDTLLSKVFNIRTRTRVGVKLPPYLDPMHIKMASNILQKYDINHITCINSLGNGLVVNPVTEKVAIKPKGGLGGIGGGVVKSIGLSNVYQFSQLLPRTGIIGCGGIVTGVDAFEYILVGASAVQLGTVLYEEGLGCFQRIDTELKEIMKDKKYMTIFDFKGKVIL